MYSEIRLWNYKQTTHNSNQPKAARKFLLTLKSCSVPPSVKCGTLCCYFTTRPELNNLKTPEDKKLVFKVQKDGKLKSEFVVKEAIKKDP